MRRLLVGVVVSGALVALSGSAVAAPGGTVSNVQLLLDDSVVVAGTSDSVALVGFIHVQTKVDSANALVAVSANVSADFVAYREALPASPDPEMQRLLERQNELKARMSQLKLEIIAVEARLLELQAQIPEECGLDLLFVPPGLDLLETCPSMGAFVAIAIRVSLQQLADLTAEAQAILEEMKALLKEIQKRLGKGELFRYAGEGTFNAESVLVGSDTQLIGAFTLTSPQGVRRSFTVQLSMSFSPAGKYRAGEVELACRATGICFPDSGL